MSDARCNYWVATAHPTEPGNGRLQAMYVGAGPDHTLPGRTKWTRTARNPQELLRVVSDLLIGEGVISAGVDRGIPIPHDDLTFVHDNVKRVTVDGSSIRVLVKDARTIEETRDALRRQLTSMVRRADPRNRDVIRDRVDPARKTITLVFSLPGSLRDRVVEPTLLRRIGVMLDLDPATLQRVKTAIENPE